MVNDGIQQGVITRIYAKTFVTYDEVTVRPGRNLNLILGPNGTGKSTIVSAIVLGLGGTTKVIGRATHIGDFVKSGYNTATIEIDLQIDQNNHITIKRTFDTKNNSTWFMKDKQVNFKAISDLMKTLNIQVDNLCQFLPQDKVQDFSKMLAPELLRETERSVGDPKLVKHHDKLIELRKKQAELEKELEVKSKRYAQHKQTYDMMKDTVGHINEQKQHQKKLKQLKQKKAWILYQNKREEFAQAKAGRDKAQATMKKAEKKLEPVKQKIAKIKSSIQTLEKTAKQHLNETTAKRGKLTKLVDEVERHERSVDEIDAQCQEEIKAEQECDERINQYMEDKSRMENDVIRLTEEIGRSEELEEKLQSVNREMMEQRNSLNEQKSKEAFFKQQIDHLNKKIKNDERSLQEVCNIENKRLDLLRRQSNDTYEGVMWLRNNRHLFSKPIHEPMLLTINLKDPSYSKYFENTIAQRDLTAFVCEDKNDMNLLLKYLRNQQKLKVNAVHSDPDREVDCRPIVPLEDIRQYGFTHYLVSLIEAPETVMKFLISMYKLNEIPIGSDKVANNCDQIPDKIRKFFSATNSYAVNRSKYTGEKSIRQSNVGSRDLLAITVDKNKVNRIQQEMNASKEKVGAITEELHSCLEQIASISQKIESIKVNRNKIQTNKSKLDNLKVRLSVIDESISKEQKNRRNVDDIHKEFKKKIQNAIKTQLNVYHTYCNMQDECFKSTIIDEEMKLQVKLKKNEQAVLENDSQDLQAELNEAERNYKTLDNELQPLKEEVKKLYNEAKEKTDGLCYDDKEFAPMKAIFAKLPATIEEIVQEMHSTQAKIFNLRDDQAEANRIVQQFDDAKKGMEALDGEIKIKENELSKVTEDINKIKDEWLPALSNLVDEINSNFSNYFVKMQCAGEISLCHDSNPMDFEKYGLKIRVKFRDRDELQELNRNRQSGGERAVTTAIYMIALQELTRVPFRCVDEINQGMDAANERRVFELIVNITSQANSSQYFLLTPKLLPNLKYNESVTVLTVFNGPHMIPTSKFDSQDIDKIVEVIKKRQSAVH